jgi:2-polyprenyl-3-methyl-5-hydroxy-6-metoxy-1,4-benzoquinol methylase
MGISSRLSQVALLAQARGFEAQIVACGLKLLDEVGGPGDQGAPALLGQGQTERSRPMGFAPTWRPEALEIGPLFDPGVAGGERLDRSTDSFLRPNRW